MSSIFLLCSIYFLLFVIIYCGVYYDLKKALIKAETESMPTDGVRRRIVVSRIVFLLLCLMLILLKYLLDLNLEVYLILTVSFVLKEIIELIIDSL